MLAATTAAVTGAARRARWHRVVLAVAVLGAVGGAFLWLGLDVASVRQVTTSHYTKDLAPHTITVAAPNPSSANVLALVSCAAGCVAALAAVAGVVLPLVVKRAAPSSPVPVPPGG